FNANIPDHVNSYVGCAGFEARYSSKCSDEIRSQSGCQYLASVVMVPGDHAIVEDDTDADRITDAEDNCPNIANAGQEDTDDDGVGDVCDERVWSNGETLKTTSGRQYSLSFSSNTSGQAIVLWQQIEANIPKGEIWYSFYSAGEGWSQASRIVANNPKHASSPRVVLNEQGKATALWLETVFQRDADGERELNLPGRIVITHFDPVTKNWEPSQPFTNRDSKYKGIRLTSNKTGHMIVTWNEADAQQCNLRVRSSIDGQRWTPEENLVINVPSTFSCLAKVAIDSQGRGLVVWEHFRPNHQTIIEYRQINAGQALRGNNGVIETERPPYPPYLAMNSSGDAVIYWNENKPGPDPRNPGVNRDIVAVRYKLDQGLLGEAIIVESHPQDTAPGAAIVDSRGIPYILYDQRVAAGNNSTYDVGAASFGEEVWSSLSLVHPATEVGFNDPHILLDAAENKIVLWEQLARGDGFEASAQSLILGPDYQPQGQPVTIDLGLSGMFSIEDFELGLGLGNQAIAAWIVRTGRDEGGQHIEESHIVTAHFQ
ncbi:MAG TPA: hypothetical protein DDW49_07560, partial [Deltaproteobacteria bacterium]|nr:hypothetical protein [Deltaproteobacteria bacterium]